MHAHGTHLWHLLAIQAAPLLNVQSMAQPSSHRLKQLATQYSLESMHVGYEHK